MAFRRSIIALSLAFLIGLFAVLPGLTTNAYGFDNSSAQAQLTAAGSYQTVAWHRHWHHYYPYGYYGYYDPYYYDYPYGYSYGPGFSIYIR